MPPRSTTDAADALIPLGLVAGAWAVHRTELYRVLVGEDAVYEWAQVVALAAAVVWLVQARGRLRLAAAAALVVVIGEELAWGTRLFDGGVPAIEERNAQGETTLHNIGAGLELSFAAIAVASMAAIVWLWTRRSRRWTVVWFAVPAAYAAFRLVAHVDYEVAKLSEAAELCFAGGVARTAWMERTRRRRAAAHRAPN